MLNMALIDSLIFVGISIFCMVGVLAMSMRMVAGK